MSILATIRDIAKASGYSIATVSRAINHSGYVSAKAQQAIERVVAELDYAPNAIAQDLSAGVTHTIGVVLPHSNHPYFTQLLNGIMDAAFDSGYKITILPSGWQRSLELEYLEQLRRKAFDAMIFTSHGIPLKELAAYQRYGRIVICEDPKDTDLPAAYSDREVAYRAAFRWLQQKQVTHIGFLLSRAQEHISATSYATLRAFRAIYGRTPGKDWIISGINTYEDGYHTAEKFHQHQIEPEYIFSNGDDVAVGVRQYYIQQHLPIPGLVGQENQLTSKLLNIPTIDHHFVQIGAAAFELATHPEATPDREKFQSEFILRGI
ncbi:transcriptional regulator [Agrilactobacillus composti DSM 18527 = JCM 14202]|uniref:Transcriptional regulator n=1 Tax=Agrilactobacillus composti DSM 18527 = JCM 14202 TaxID=1423734 RepID=A0A0R1Y297_9LACO|nr:transcriptional regulator [Agrilactobacillus composti DSM 18527 = JCM 14202]